MSVSDAIRARAVEEQVAVMKEQLAAMQETLAKIERKSGELLDAIGGLQNQINTLWVQAGAAARERSLYEHGRRSWARSGAC